MKALKLTLLFFVIVAGLLDAFYVLGNDGNGKKTSRADDKTFQEYRSQFSKDWENAADWNEQLYRTHCETLKQLSASRDVESLRDMDSKMATEIVNKKVFAEWKSAQCRKEVVDKYIGAVVVIESEDPNASADPVIKKIKQVDKVYRSAYSLAHQSVGLKPHFNGNGWSSYSSYESQMKRRQQDVLSNDAYKEYLCDIADIKNGLNSLPTKVSNAKDSYYNLLANQIYAYYSRISRTNRTNSELQGLRNAVTRFQQEFHSNGKLSTLLKEYRADVMQYN